jgi:hypothetical protein
MELLKMDIKLQNPKDMETAMSLARAYKQRTKVVTSLTKSTSTRATRMAPQPTLAL